MKLKRYSKLNQESAVPKGIHCLQQRKDPTQRRKEDQRARLTGERLVWGDRRSYNGHIKNEAIPLCLVRTLPATDKGASAGLGSLVARPA